MTAPSLGRVLIVDDKVELMTALCESLTDQGYEALGRKSAQEALDRSSADFTGARLSERAQHARQAAARAAAARQPADQDVGQPGERGADQAVAVAADPQAEGDSLAAAAEQATAQWAWLPIAAMTVPLLLLLLVALV